MSRPGRPRSVGVDYARVRDLQVRGYGARRIARELGPSVSTIRRVLRGLRPERAEDAELLRAARERAGSKRAGSEPRSKRRVRNAAAASQASRATPQFGQRTAPEGAVDDWEMETAVRQLAPFRGDTCTAELRRVAGRMARELRLDPTLRAGQIVDRYMIELLDVGSRRGYWIEAARRDLERRWNDEMRFARRHQDELDLAARSAAASDASSQLERLEELLERRLAAVPCDQTYFDVVDRLVDDGLRRHRARVRQLTLAVRAKRSAAEEQGA